LGDLRPLFQRRLHRAILRLADHVLVNSPAVADCLERERVVDPERIVVIPNGVDVSRFCPGGDLGRSPTDIARVATLAKLRPEKGIVDIVHAAAMVRERCANVRFILWGDGVLRSDLERTIRANDLDRWVELRGGTTDPAAALRELDILVLASHSEACSNTLL